MRWDTHNRRYWDIGNRAVFRFSKDRCQALLAALLLCDGKITDMDSLDVWDGEIRYGMKPHECAVLIRVTLPIGAEDRFREMMGDVLEEPPVFQTN